MELSSLRHSLSLVAKRTLYGRRGEPYPFAGQKLRYVPGTCPVRPKHAHSDNWVNRYDALQIMWLAANMKLGDTAIDIGAHHGIYSVLMAAKCGPTGQIVAFEPDPHARNVLAKNLRLNPWLKPPRVEEFACSDRNGSAILFSRKGSANSSLESSAVDDSEKIPVSLITLDSYLETHDLPELRCVKIDTEGAEIRVLKGSAGVLAGKADILCELHPYAWPEFGNTLAELKDIAAAAHRRIRYLDEETTIGTEAHYGTVLLELRQ